MSYNDVLASAYVTNDGYRYATESEVSLLFTNAGGVPTQSPAFSPGNLAASQLLLSLMGCTSYLVSVPCGGTDEWSAGMWGDTAGRIALIEALIRPPTYAHGLLATRWVQVAGPDAVYRADVASFLVMPSAVPVPAAVWLFGTALIGFVGISRRRKVA
ncbi:MAG: VPLPA-CTERM sorting domain-containing protein [Gammaproteobacteria bacterium]|nr:VPLPA-CTERM sorting domain-containing protein [Gammaproteobacteria bacterium]